MLQATHTAATSPAKAVLKGQGWGALDNLMQESRGRKPVAPYLDFGGLEPAQQVWYRFLKNG